MTAASATFSNSLPVTAPLIARASSPERLKRSRMTCSSNWFFQFRTAPRLSVNPRACSHS